MGPKEVDGCEYVKQSFFFSLYLLIVVLFSVRATGKLRWPDPVLQTRETEIALVASDFRSGTSCLRCYVTSSVLLRGPFDQLSPLPFLPAVVSLKDSVSSTPAFA